MQATPKVLEMLSNVITSDVREENVLSQLHQFIRSMRIDEVQRFLRFVTGSSRCSMYSFKDYHVIEPVTYSVYSVRL